MGFTWPWQRSELEDVEASREWAGRAVEAVDRLEEVTARLEELVASTKTAARRRGGSDAGKLR